MSDAFSDAISDDDSPAPEAPHVHRDLLGDPATEGNEHLFEQKSEEGPVDPDADDDVHFPLNDADVQN